jgi:hypothetical protein
MAPYLARRLLYAIAAVCVIVTGAIALVRPAPPPAPQPAPVAQGQPVLPVAGYPPDLYSVNGSNSSSFSLQKLCASSDVTCVKVVLRSAPP